MQDGMKHDTMKHDDMKHDDMKHDDMKHDDMAPDKRCEALFTGTFHGKVAQHERARDGYQARTAENLRLTHFKTSNGPDVHVILLQRATRRMTRIF